MNAYSVLGMGMENRKPSLFVFLQEFACFERDRNSNKNNQGTQWIGWVFKDEQKFTRQTKPVVRVAGGERIEAKGIVQRSDVTPYSLSPNCSLLLGPNLGEGKIKWQIKAQM